METKTKTTKTKTRRGGGKGPTLTPKTCVLGAVVRVTGGSFMAGQHGVVVGSADSATPLVRFQSGQELKVSMYKLQYIEDSERRAAILRRHSSPTLKSKQIKRTDADWNF